MKPNYEAIARELRKKYKIKRPQKDLVDILEHYNDAGKEALFGSLTGSALGALLGGPVGVIPSALKTGTPTPTAYKTQGRYNTAAAQLDFILGRTRLSEDELIRRLHQLSNKKEPTGKEIQSLIKRLSN